MRERFIAVTNGCYDERSTLRLKLIRARPSVNLVKSGRKRCRFTTGHFIHPRSAVRRSRFFAAPHLLLACPVPELRRVAVHHSLSREREERERSESFRQRKTRKRIICGMAFSLRCHSLTKRSSFFVDLRRSWRVSAAGRGNERKVRVGKERNKRLIWITL